MSEFVEFVDEVCGIYFRSIVLGKCGDRISQHVHDHDHATYIGSGAVRVWVNGDEPKDCTAGTAIPILAGHQHIFEALADDTRLTCVHDAASAASVKEKGL